MDSVPTVARPRPPAKVRRSPSNQRLQSSPPPPYAAGFTFPPLSPNATAEELSSKFTPFPLTGISEEWMNEASREGLREILKKADGLIKCRSNGEFLLNLL
jgi:hypothetical protein